MKVRLRRRNVELFLTKINRSQNWLSFRLEISSGHLSQFMTGKRNPSPMMRRRIMKVLKGCSWDYLFQIINCKERRRKVIKNCER